MIALSIIILSYNTKDLTLQCVQSIIKHYKKQLEDGEFEIIVVDNASSDGTIEAIQNSKFKIQNYNAKLKIIRNKENLGFPKGNNIGAKQGRGKYFFFLNSDTEIRDDGVGRMISFLDEHQEVAILGAKLSNTDGSLQPSVGKFYHLINLFFMLFGGERMGLLRESPTKITPVDWVSGAAMMVRKDTLEVLQGFDERFFMYVEDMELCFRVKQKGLKTYFYPDIVIEHREQGSSNRSFAILSIYKGLLYFYQKHTPFWKLALARLMLKSKAAIAVCIGMLTNNSYLKETYAKAFQLV